MTLKISLLYLLSFSFKNNSVKTLRLFYHNYLEFNLKLRLQIHPFCCPETIKIALPSNLARQWAI